MREQSEVWKFLHHQVRISIQGYGLSRLISKAMNEGVRFRNLEYIDETEVKATVSKEDYIVLKKLAKSTFKLEKLREKGIAPTAEKLKKRKLLPVGVAIFIIYFIVQGMFIREININGLSSIPEETVRQSLANHGLYEGCLKNFNCKEIEKTLFQDFNNIVYANVEYQGRYVEVSIAENAQMPKKLVKGNKPCDIVADFNGYIESIEDYRGKKKVSVGDFVRKGDILIEGTVPIEYFSYQPTEDDPENYYVHAAAKIMARVPYYYSFTMTKGADKKLAIKRREKWIRENIPQNTQILNKSLNFVVKENIIRVYGIIETRQQIGIEKEILIDNRNRRTEKDSN